MLIPSYGLHHQNWLSLFCRRSVGRLCLGGTTTSEVFGRRCASVITVMSNQDFPRAPLSWMNCQTLSRAIRRPARRHSSSTRWSALFRTTVARHEQRNPARYIQFCCFFFLILFFIFPKQTGGKFWIMGPTTCIRWPAAQNSNSNLFLPSFFFN